LRGDATEPAGCKHGHSAQSVCARSSIDGTPSATYSAARERSLLPRQASERGGTCGNRAS
jgi:hypothetical protein